MNSFWVEVNNSYNYSSITLPRSIRIHTQEPEIHLIEPIPESEISSESVEKIFYYNATSDFGIENCSLIINEEIVLNNSDVSEIENNFTKSFLTGDYVWEIDCYDTLGLAASSESNNFEISLPTSQSQGGGGGGSKTEIIKEDLEVQNFYTSSQLSEQVERVLKNTEKIFFDLGKENEENHSLSIEKIGADYVFFVIKSNPIFFELKEGESKKVNITSKEYYELEIKLNFILDEKADITIKKINESILKNNFENLNFIEEINKTQDFQEEVTTTEKRDWAYKITILVIIIIFLIILNKLRKALIKEKEIEKVKKVKK